jgi:hypothetical protein
MTTIPIRCTVNGCDAVVQVKKSTHDDYDGLIGLECPRGHRFDYDKDICPKCGSATYQATFQPEQAWHGDRPPGHHSVFKPARCRGRECGWEGPKA